MGAREGKPTLHTWEPPPPEPPQFPVAAASSLKVLFWLLILVPLFLFRVNRPPQALWLWLPIVVSTVVGIALTCPMSDSEWSLPQAACSFVVGLAAAWLLMPFLGSQYRVLAFFKTLLVLSGISLLAFLPTLLGRDSSWFNFRPFLAVLLALGCLAVTLALTLSSLCVRRRFGRIRFLVWLVLWTVLSWAVIAPSLVILSSLKGDIDWRASIVPVLFLSAVCLALLLPLVLLAFFEPFYRSRLFAYLRIPQPGPPVESAIPPKLSEVC